MSKTVRFIVTADGMGDVVFKTLEDAKDFAAQLDADGTDHDPVKRVELGYDPDDVREIGGG